MKKLLSILGITSLLTTTITNIVACSVPIRNGDEDQIEPEEKLTINKFNSFRDFLSKQLIIDFGNADYKPEDFKRPYTHLENRENWWYSNSDDKKNEEKFWDYFQTTTRRRIDILLGELNRENDYVVDQDGVNAIPYLKKVHQDNNDWDTWERFFDNIFEISTPDIPDDWEGKPEASTNSIIDAKNAYRTYIQKGYVEVRVYEPTLLFDLKPINASVIYESFYITDYEVTNTDGSCIWFDVEDIPLPEIEE
ncbi:hypothetical protein SCHIN_v1c10500 [Spiroplasma chinense]|uniref:Lipoprotein n=1 Tax=Spiroplasma chinense TaxID=216932 RepID=A0A5B9Y616_9MOLU|nr:lipoprotein [Spiroplasma chinense]QEH62243.1 hypothetical protein SCHIN_v1c10500 [Spiroplasma chinense]